MINREWVNSLSDKELARLINPCQLEDTHKLDCCGERIVELWGNEMVEEWLRSERKVNENKPN